MRIKLNYIAPLLAAGAAAVAISAAPIAAAASAPAPHGACDTGVFGQHLWYSRRRRDQCLPSPR